MTKHRYVNAVLVYEENKHQTHKELRRS